MNSQIQVDFVNITLIMHQTLQNSLTFKILDINKLLFLLF